MSVKESLLTMKGPLQRPEERVRREGNREKNGVGRRCTQYMGMRLQEKIGVKKGGMEVVSRYVTVTAG